MAFIQYVTTAVTTDASGDATGFTDVVTGFLEAIRYTPDGTSPLDATTTVTITDDVTGQTLWTETFDGTAAAQRAPRQPTHGTDGTALAYAAGGEPVDSYIALANTRIKTVISGGGNALSGTFGFWIS